MRRQNRLTWACVFASVALVIMHLGTPDPMPPESSTAPVVAMFTAAQSTAPNTIPPTAEDKHTTPEAEPERKTFNGITEGDVIIGELTYYDVCVKCCDKADGVTTSGLVIQNGVEPEIPVASCNWLPLGTLVEIKDVLYIVADRGGKGLDRIGRFDIFTPAGHAVALQLGRIKGAEITIISLP